MIFKSTRSPVLGLLPVVLSLAACAGSDENPFDPVQAPVGAGGGESTSGSSEAGGGGPGTNFGNPAGGADSAATGGRASATGGRSGSGGTVETDMSGGSMGMDNPASGGTTNSGGSSGEEGGGGSDCDDSVRSPQLLGYGSQTKGGQGGEVVTASTGTQIHAAICNRAADDTPLVIMVDGTITPGNTTKQSGSCNTTDGVIELKEISNISLIGVGSKGVLDQVGVHIRSSSHIVIQNLTIKNVRKSNTDTPSNGGDAIGMESDVHHIWIDHNEIYGSTTEGEEHDGLIDFKSDVTDVTVSFNHLHDSGRGGLVGSNDSGDDGSTNITFHHNWYEHINSRTHLVREARGHFFNNYFDRILSTGINCRNGASLLIENNYFENARNPLGTFFYLDNPGTYQVEGNHFDSTVVWEPADDQVPAGPDVQSTGSVSVDYSYELDQATCVPSIVRANAGVGRF